MKKISERELLALLKSCPSSSMMMTDSTGLTISVRRKANGQGAIKFLHRVQINRTNYRNVLGSFPYISLNEARERYFKSVQAVENNEALPVWEDEIKVDDKRVDKEKGKKINKKINTDNSEFYFVKFFDEWFDLKSSNVSENTIKAYLQARKRLEALHKVDVRDITPEIALKVFQPLIIENKLNALNATAVILMAVMDYVEFMQVIKYNPLHKLKRYLPKNKANHFACFSEDTVQDDLKVFFEKMSEQASIYQALTYFAFFTLLRPSEAISIKYSDIKGDYALIKTKTRDAFKFPLSKQALEIIEFQRKQGINSGYIFPVRDGSKHLTRNCLSMVFAKIGYKNIMTPHGIRSLGRQWLQKLPNAKESYIELCLSHAVGGMVQQAYNRGEYIEERRPLMQAWSDYICSLADKNYQKLVKMENFL